MTRWSTFELVEAFQLGHAVRALHELGVLDALARPATLAQLARRHAVDAAVLGGVLRYVAARTDLVRRRGDRFVATPRYGAAARYLIDLYAGAYGSNAAQLVELLRDPERAPGAVDRDRHARAFAAVGPTTLGALPELVTALGGDGVLDLGCGTAALLIALATRAPAFTGWGLERNAAMCRVARSRVRAARIADRVRILQGDCTTLAAALPRSIASRVRLATMCDVANELFAGGAAPFVAWLRGASKALPGCTLVVSDYYGRLDAPATARPQHRETLLQDYAQVISGQGVPPATLRAWHALYRRAGCRLVQVFEDRGTTRFIHLVRLAGHRRARLTR